MPLNDTSYPTNKLLLSILLIGKYISVAWQPKKCLMLVAHMGQGTWTRFHLDVMNSFSWSVNLAGRKLWLLLQPSDVHLLCGPGGMAPDFSSQIVAGTFFIVRLNCSCNLKIPEIGCN